jgi:6-phosphogluconolactonase
MTPRTVIVADDAQALAAIAAERLVTRLSAGAPRAAVCLTGGTTPEPLYALLATPAWRDRIPWPRVHWFIGDDRFVPPGHPWSNIGLARRSFLDACAPPSHVHPIPTDAPTPEDAAARYERELKTFHGASLDAAPLFDLVLLGVGTDGHIASLFPGASALAERQRWAAGVAKAALAPFVPRVSLTLPALDSTREMLFLVAGRDKRDILSRVFAGEELPAAQAHAAHGDTVWLVDRAAAPDTIDGRKLHVG